MLYILYHVLYISATMQLLPFARSCLQHCIYVYNIYESLFNYLMKCYTFFVLFYYLNDYKIKVC